MAAKPFEEAEGFEDGYLPAARKIGFFSCLSVYMQ